MSIAIVAALPREIAALVRGTKPDKTLQARGIFLHRVADAVIVAGGMGAARVTLAVEAALQTGQVHALISVGLAGSCKASVKAGTLLRAGVVIDEMSGERFNTAGEGETAVLVSTDQIASTREKFRLHESYRASMVDMEAATVARFACARGLPFQAIKGISDAYDFELASLARFAGAKGQFQTLKFAAYTAIRPRTWGAALQLGRNSTTALRSLTEALLPLIDPQ